MPDYNYDILSGVDYDIDVAKPVGSRITRLERDGAAVADTDRFVVAVNNYRRSGGGNFPGIVRTQVYNEQKEIRQLLIDWRRRRRDRPGRLLRAELAAGARGHASLLSGLRERAPGPGALSPIQGTSAAPDGLLTFPEICG